MLAYTYISHGKFELIDKPKPELQSPRDAIVRITLGSFSEEAKQAWRDAHWEDDLQRSYDAGRKMAEQ
jgi:hypothetical protein